MATIKTASSDTLYIDVDRLSIGCATVEGDCSGILLFHESRHMLTAGLKIHFSLKMPNTTSVRDQMSDVGSVSRVES